ncbi:hypothetical protein MtrunA17_Chr6g0468481 [Medicago truncatula]|uniref:Uncharacterized protein n=1 Tax=Medicago truncatula TaxID=3880 RepID=A0A396HFW0_MEDTR|nr:uncharacterized protein LOC112422623 [Medicago truncatula]RHN51431.1 hypothetical protein MtrunA17_Chr6g0468481 [Medicago truncatula]
MNIPLMYGLSRSAWEHCNYLIHSWILNSVSRQIAQTIVFHEYAIDVWIELQERLSKVGRVIISSLHSVINNLKQGKKLCLITCAHPCRCESMRSARNFCLEDEVIQFLTRLNDTFEVVKNPVLLMDPLPSINKVYSLVTQEESNNHGVTAHFLTRIIILLIFVIKNMVSLMLTRMNI